MPDTEKIVKALEQVLHIFKKLWRWLWIGHQPRNNNYEKCRRCYEGGADHYIDENGALVYLCKDCRYLIRESDPVKPIKIRTDGTIISGHGRAALAKKLGLTEITCEEDEE